MNSIKKYSISIIGIIVSISLVALLLTVFYYFDFISTNTYKYLKLITLLITLVINSIFLGKKSLKNGYIDGIKLGLMLIIFCTLVSIVNKCISIKLIIYSLIILLTTTFGSILGINLNKDKRI